MRPKCPSILLIANNFPPVLGGSSVVYKELANRAGGKVVVLAPSRSYIDCLALKGWQSYDDNSMHFIYRLPLLRLPLQKAKPGRLKKLFLNACEVVLRIVVSVRTLYIIKKHNVTAVCVGELISNGWMLPLIRRWLNVRTVAYIHGEELTTDDGYDSDGKKKKKYLNSADVIIAVSGFTEKVIYNLINYNHKKNNIIKVENGVDYKKFSQVDNSEGVIRNKYSLGDNFVFISVCRLVEKKGIDNAIKAFSRLHSRHKNTRYVIVGDGIYRDYLEQLAKDLCVSDYIVFTGGVPDSALALHYHLGDVFVMPNRKLPTGDTEGFGLVFLEANAAGLPVIAGRDGGSVDAVTHEENGLVVDGTSVEEIDDAMERLFSDCNLRKELSTRGLMRAQNNDWGEKANKFIIACLGRSD